MVLKPHQYIQAYTNMALHISVERINYSINGAEITG